MRLWAVAFVLLAPALAFAEARDPPDPAPPQLRRAPTPEAGAPIEPIIRTAPPPAPAPRRRVRRAEPPPAPAPPQEDLPAAVTDEDIAVTSDYRGFRVTVFGVNPDRRGRGDIVVVLRGPSQSVIVRRKTRFLGLWVNGPPVRFNGAPSFLSVVSARPLRDIARPEAIWALGLDGAASPRLVGSTPPGADPSDYRQALVRLRRANGLFSENPRGLQTLESGLFVTQVRIPAYAPIGAYSADVYLFRGGRLISSRQRRVMVSRQGVERTVHDFALRLPLLYGVATVAIAFAAGWGASVMLRRGGSL